MTLYINREERQLLYGDEEAMGYMLDMMDLTPGYGMSLSTWVNQESEPVRYMRTDVLDGFFYTPDWQIVKDADREDIDKVEIELFGQVSW